MASVTLTNQKVVDVTGPLIILALASGLVPIAPVLPTSEFLINILVAITRRAVARSVGIVDPVLAVIIAVVAVIVAVVI